MNKRGQISLISLAVLGIIVVTLGVIVIDYVANVRTDINTDTYSKSETILEDNGSAQTLSGTPTSFIAQVYNKTWLECDGTNDLIN